MSEKRYELVGLTYEEAREIVDDRWAGLISHGHAYPSNTLVLRPMGCQCDHCNAYSAVETAPEYVADTERSQFRGVTHEPCLNCGKRYRDHIAIADDGARDVCPHGPL